MFDLSADGQIINTLHSARTVAKQHRVYTLIKRTIFSCLSVTGMHQSRESSIKDLAEQKLCLCWIINEHKMP